MQSVIEAHPLDEEMRIMRSQLEAAGTHMLFSAPWLPGENGASAYQPAIDSMRAAGLNITGTTQPRAAGFLSGLNTFILFSLRSKSEESWQKRTPVPERLALIKDQAFREQLIADGKAMQLAEAHRPDPFLAKVWPTVRKNILDGQRGTTKLRPSTGPIVSSSRQSRWRAPGRDLAAFATRIRRTGLLSRTLRKRGFERTAKLYGCRLGCAGRRRCRCSCQYDHGCGLDQLLHFSLHRDTGTYSIEETIHMLTAKQNRVLGLPDRGALVVGNKADINVLDIDRVEERQPRRVEDFPATHPD